MSFSIWLLVFFPFSFKDVLWYRLFDYKTGAEVCVYVCAQSCPTLCNPIDCSCQSALSIEFSRQEYWHGLPFPPPGDLPNPGTLSLWLLPLAGGFFTTGPPGKPSCLTPLKYHTFQPIMRGDQMCKFLPDNESEESCAFEHNSFSWILGEGSCHVILYYDSSRSTL